MSSFPELSFFCKALHNMHIDTVLISKAQPFPQNLDRGVRSFLHLEAEYQSLFEGLWARLKPNTIYKMTDDFLLHYIFLLLPERETTELLIAGPYICSGLTHDALSDKAKENHISSQNALQLEKYYAGLPTVADESQLFSLCNTLGEILWGNMESFAVKTLNYSFPESASPLLNISAQKPEDTLLAMQALELRYAAENELILAVSRGMSHKAEQIISHLSEITFERRAQSPLQNIKNYYIILNTLLRKAAEHGAVHPLYIDVVSSDFALRIEALTSAEKGGNLPLEMVRGYCALVKKHAMKQYSPFVQKVLTIAEVDLTADLSLRSLSALLNVNASYLSALFKKETGQTLTEHVTQKRIEQAAFLLQTTHLQIQSVAQHCGILDVNYFTKIFKKHTGFSPKEFREKNIRL